MDRSVRPKRPNYGSSQPNVLRYGRLALPGDAVYPIEVTRKLDHERRNVSIRPPLERLGQYFDG